MSSLAACTALEDTVRKSKKIRIYPTKKQKGIFRRWFGVQRLVYNRAVEYLKTTDKKGHWMGVAKQILSGLPEFCVEVPYQIKKMAVKEAFDAFYRNVKNVKLKGGSFALRFRSRKTLSNRVIFPSRPLATRGYIHGCLGRACGMLKIFRE